NAIYDSPAVAKPTAYQRPAEAPNAVLLSWRAAAAKVHADLGPLLAENRAFFAARGPAALEAKGILGAAVDLFEKERITDVEDAGAALDDAARRKSAEYARQLRRLAADLRAKEFDLSLDAEGLAERFRLAAIEQEIGAAAKPK